MDSKLIGIIADQDADLNFIVWTLYHMSGQQKYYYYGLDYWFEVEDDPITMNGQYAQVEVEIDGASEITEYEERISQLSKYNDRPGFRVIVTRIQENVDPDARIIARMQEECDHILVVSSFGKPSLHANKVNKFDHEDKIDDYLNEYFADSKESWGNDIVDIWNKREFMALNMRPWVSIDASKYVDLTKRHFPITYLDLYQNLDKVLFHLVNFLDTDSYSHEDRITHWHKIYYTWRSSNCEQIMWDQNFEVIIKYIVNGHSMDLSMFKLDILREAAIQHALLYKHNLAIKGHGIEVLPTNTKEIHALLEPNFHELPPY